MLHGRIVARFLIAGALLAGIWVSAGDPGHAVLGAPGDKKEAKDEKKEEKKKRSGGVVGTLTKRGPNFVEVKADGEEKARRYVPRWVGGAPAQGGGFDKKTLKAIGGLKEGSRVRLEWEFEERPRVVRIEMLKGTEEKK